jgi:dTDP-4-dehydrorhamnose 3,5-epimerase
MINGVILTPLKSIFSEGGNVFHAIKSSDSGYKKFSEAYFTTIDYLAIKPWKKHNQMTLNLIVIHGEIQFVVYDDRNDSPSYKLIEHFTLSPEKNYARLTVPPGLYVAFQGLSEQKNIALNVADIIHEPSEIDRQNLNFITYSWRQK